MKEFLKMIEMFMSMFFGQRQMFMDKSQAFSIEILNQLRQVFFLIMVGVGAIISFCLGMNFFIDRLLNQLDQGQYALTPSIVFLFIFLIICAAALLYSTKKKNWIKIFKNKNDDEDASEEKSQAQGPNYPGSQIESVIKDREIKRETAVPTSTPEKA
jgi:uncharacterized protein YacL